LQDKQETPINQIGNTVENQDDSTESIVSIPAAEVSHDISLPTETENIPDWLQETTQTESATTNTIE